MFAAMMIITSFSVAFGALAYKCAIAPFAADIDREAVLKRVRAEREARERSARRRTADVETGLARLAAIVERVLPITRDGERAYRDRLDRAGIHMGAARWRGICVVTAVASGAVGCVAGGAVAQLVGNAVGAACGAAGGWIACRGYVSAKAKARREEIEKALPDALERLSTIMLSGMSVDEAMREVSLSREMGPVAEEFGRVDREINLINLTREEALGGMARRCQSIDMTFFVSALNQASREGASISGIVEQQSRSARAAWFGRLRERINKIDTRISLPLGLCFLPAAVVLTCAPILVTTVANLGRMLG